MTLQQNSNEREEKLREGLACALISLMKLERGIKPETTALEIALAAVSAKPAVDTQKLECALLTSAGLPPPYNERECAIHNAIEGTLETLVDLWKRREPKLEQIRKAIEIALKEDVVDIDQIDSALTRRACGTKFSRKASAQTHKLSHRHEATPRKGRPWVEKHERERMKKWLGEEDPKPRRIERSGESETIPEAALDALKTAENQIENAERNALLESDIIAGRTQDTNEGPRRGEDLYTRRARLERLRWRLHDARTLFKKGMNKQAWQIAAATCHRATSAEETNRAMLTSSSDKQQP